MGFINLGTRNKGTFWEYISAYSFLNTALPNTKYRIKSFLGAGENLANKHCHHTNDIEKFKKLFVKEFNEGRYNKEFFRSLMEEYNKPFLEIKKITKQDFLKDDNERLAEKIKQIAIAIGKTHTPMLMGLYTMYLEDFYTDKLKEILGKEKEAKISLLKSILLTTKKTSFVQEEEEYIFKIEDLFFKNNKITKKAFNDFCLEPIVKKKLKHLVENFGWFHMEYSYDPYTSNDYKKDLWERIKNGNKNKKSLNGAKKEIEKKQDEFFTTYSGNPKINYFQKLTYVLQEFAFILDHTKVITIKGIFASRPLFLEVSERLNISLSDMLFLTFPEIGNLLQNNKTVDKKIIKERRKYRATLLKDKKIQVYEGKKAKELIEKLLPQNHKDEKQVKGIVIYPGIVRGKVTIINSIKDRNKFKKGDILVSHDGSAELTTFLQQASAIITDEGGMICHSAIIAREMETPCIVGTKIATKVLKDGDKVEVDANKGIVKILKKNSK